MTDDELAEVVQNLRALGGDISDVEAKRAMDKLPNSTRETLSAFSNTSGGILILGLDEAAGFKATGVSDASKMASDLASVCAIEMEPALRPLIRIHELDQVQVVVAEVPELPPSSKPCFYKGAGMTQGSFVRVHDGDQRLSSYEVQMLLASRGQPKDDLVETEADLSDLNTEMVEALLARLRAGRPFAFRDLNDEQVLRRAGVLGATLRPTVAGLLSLGSFPQAFYPQLMATFIHYPTMQGEDQITGVRFLDNVAFEGPIPVMVRDAMAALRRNMSKRAVVSGVGRADSWEYPETALREALVNALVHRDLSEPSLGTQVQIEMFPDRLRIRNPGGLFGPVTVDTLGDQGISSARNSALLRILEDVAVPGDTRTVCENRGSGIVAMFGALRSAGMSPPEFDNKIASFAVTFPNHTLLGVEVVSWIHSLDQSGLTDTQCMALAIMRNGDTMDNSAYRAMSGVDSRIATIELRDLVARELVLQEGSRRWARYRLAQRPSGPGESENLRRRAPSDRRREILAALGLDTCSRSEVASRTGLNDQVVLRWLRILRSEGLVEITTADRPQSRSTRYKRTPSGDVAGQAHGSSAAEWLF